MRNLSVALALMFGLAMTPPARADDEFDALLKDFDDAQAHWFEQVRKLSEDAKPADSQPGADRKPDDEAAQQPALRMPPDMPPHPAAKFMTRFRAYAEKHSGKPEAVPALSWIIGAGGMSVDEEEEGPGPVEWALEQLSKHHVSDPAIKVIFGDLRYALLHAPAPLRAFYEHVIKDNPDADAKAGAMFNLASLLYEGSPFADQDGAGDDKRAAEKKRGAELFRRLVKEFPGSEAGQAAEAYVFEIDHLQVGMTAPDFEGGDADGRPIKLSHFRDKVVVAYFWGFW
jgi:hypothetical protein